MKKFLIAAATLATAVSAAAPAAAQYYQQSPYGSPYAYGQNNYGYSYGNGSRVQQQINQLRRQIRQLDLQNTIGHREAMRLDWEAQSLQQRARQFGYNGIDPRETRYLEQRVASLEYQVQRVVSSHGYGSNRYGYNGYGYNQNGSRFDRDHDGRDDRYENDRDDDNGD